MQRILAGHRPADVAHQLGCSRATVYKWLRRYRSEGPHGLMDRPSRPRRCPHRTPVTGRTLTTSRPPPSAVGVTAEALSGRLPLPADAGRWREGDGRRLATAACLAGAALGRGQGCRDGAMSAIAAAAAPTAAAIAPRRPLGRRTLLSGCAAKQPLHVGRSGSGRGPLCFASGRPVHRPPPGCRRRLNNHPPLPVEKSPTPAA